MYNKNYLSKRPFVVITNRYRPAPGARTEQKGWADRAGWQTLEEMTVVDRVTDKHTTYATVIIDVMEAKVVRNGLKANTTDEEVLTHFMGKYKKQISEAVSIWMERKAYEKAQTDIKDINVGG
jgi:hypothetical protein